MSNAAISTLCICFLFAGISIGTRSERISQRSRALEFIERRVIDDACGCRWIYLDGKSIFRCGPRQDDEVVIGFDGFEEEA